jgi:hypothetical protein
MGEQPIPEGSSGTWVRSKFGASLFIVEDEKDRGEWKPEAALEAGGDDWELP